MLRRDTSYFRRNLPKCFVLPFDNAEGKAEEKEGDRGQQQQEGCNEKRGFNASRSRLRRLSTVSLSLISSSACSATYKSAHPGEVCHQDGRKQLGKEEPAVEILAEYKNCDFAKVCEKIQNWGGAGLLGFDHPSSMTCPSLSEKHEVGIVVARK